MRKQPVAQITATYIDEKGYEVTLTAQGELTLDTKDDYSNVSLDTLLDSSCIYKTQTHTTLTSELVPYPKGHHYTIRRKQIMKTTIVERTAKVEYDGTIPGMNKARKLVGAPKDSLFVITSAKSKSDDEDVWARATTVPVVIFTWEEEICK